MSQEGCGWNLGCSISEGAQNWVQEAAANTISDLAKSIAEALSQVVTTLSTFWVDMPTSNLTTADGIAPSPTVAFLQDGLWYWTAALAVLAVIIGAIRLMWEQRGAPIRDLLRGLLTLALVSGMGLAVIAFLIVAADGFSAWIIDQATDGNGFAPTIQTMLLVDMQEIAVFMVIVMGLIGILTSVVQIVLMVVRSGMLVILAGILPTTAAFTNTEMGRQWFQKAVGWTLAFILYKPAAAIVYAVAFRLLDRRDAGQAGNALLNTITGLALMIVALIALPALMRFVTPLVGAVASGGGGMGAAALGAAAAALPSGARSLGAAGRGSGTATPTPSTNGGNNNSGTGGGAGTGGPPSGSRNPGSTTTGGARPAPASTSATAGSPRGGAPSGAPAAAPTGAGAAAVPVGQAASGARAGAAAGPWSAAAGTALKGAAAGAAAARNVSEEATGEGPSGSNSNTQ